MLGNFNSCCDDVQPLKYLLLLYNGNLASIINHIVNIFGDRRFPRGCDPQIEMYELS